MKKPYEYLEDIEACEFTASDDIFHRNSVVEELLKQVQTDAIDAACKRCSEEAEADFEPMGWLAEQHASNPFIEGEDYEVAIIRGTILEVAEKMKEELK